MFGIGIQTFYNLIDLLFIGKISGDAIAGVAFNMPIFFLMLGLTMGLGSGVTASIARFIGEDNKNSADNSGGTCFGNGWIYFCCFYFIRYFLW